MAEIVELETDEGIVVFEAVETRRVGDEVPTSKGKSGVVRRKLEEALEPLRIYAQGVAKKIEGLEPKPEEVSVKVGVSITGEAGVIFAKAETTGQMEVTLKWSFKD